MPPRLRRFAPGTAPAGRRHGHGSTRARRRRSYRLRLARAVAGRYLTCLGLVTASLAGTLAAVPFTVAPPIVFGVYACCGLYLRRFIATGSIMLSVESAQEIAEERRAMQLLWPVHAARFLLHLHYPPAAATAPPPAR